jgi:hypothetical protein
MQWNTIQCELFDIAGSLGDLLQTAKLGGEIARLLHKHEDESSVGCIAKPNMITGEADGS